MDTPTAIPARNGENVVGVGKVGTTLTIKENFMTEDELVRMIVCSYLNKRQYDRAALEQECGKVWSTEELCQDFEVLAFRAPYVVVKRREDQQLGSLLFQHAPRYYFEFEAHNSPRSN